MSCEYPFGNKTANRDCSYPDLLRWFLSLGKISASISAHVKPLSPVGGVHIRLGLARAPDVRMGTGSGALLPSSLTPPRICMFIISSIPAIISLCLATIDVKSTTTTGSEFLSLVRFEGLFDSFLPPSLPFPSLPDSSSPRSFLSPPPRRLSRWSS